VSATKPKRTYGSGSVVVHRGSWYGRWRVGDRYVKRKLGAIRQPGSHEGLTRKQAEMALRRQMTEVRVVVPEERMTVQEAGDRYLHHVEHVRHRKPSTVQDYRIILNKHLVPHFGSKSIDRIDPRDVAAFITAKSRPKDKGGLSRKTLVNHLNFAHGVFAFALRRGWCTSNPVAATDRPEAEQTDPDIRFLDLAELEALLTAAAIRASRTEEGEGGPDVRGHTDHVLYLTAAMTGMRLGELVALRWRDVDRAASVIRVRRNYTRGNLGTPKSRRSSRALPMAARLGGELEHHYRRSFYQGDEDLVFCHPRTGDPYDSSQVRIRFYAAMKAAGMGHRCGRDGGITFHSLRHTFGTRMAAAGVPMRTLQEWMGHRNLATTEIYADYAPDPAYGPAFAERAFSANHEPIQPGQSAQGAQRSPSGTSGDESTSQGKQE
jgi:integrase